MLNAASDNTGPKVPLASDATPGIVFGRYGRPLGDSTIRSIERPKLPRRKNFRHPRQFR